MTPFEFCVWCDRRTYQKSLVLPACFSHDGLNRNQDLYLLNSGRVRSKVKFVTPVHGPVTIKGYKWSKFAQENITNRVFLLHFIKEGDDTWYVTGYESNGHEAGGYDRIEGRYSRFQTRVWASAPLRIPGCFLTGLGQAGSITINVEGNRFMVPVQRVNVRGMNVGYEYEVLNETWEMIKERVHLKAGMIVVFTKELNTQFWMMAFNGNGSPHTNPHYFGATTLHPIQPQIPFEDKDDDRMHHICRWPAHRDHFRESEDTFYKRFSYIVVKQRLTIPAAFLEHHPMHMYRHAVMKHQNVQYTMTVKMEVHKESPDRTNHINVFGEWTEFATACKFEYEKMIRFRFMYLLNDVVGPVTEEIRVFHVC